MKEFESKSGGRYVFNEDFQNLQELALSMTSLFEDFNTNFVISGCVISKSGSTISVSSGFVFLDGKIRKVSAKQGSDSNNIGVHIVAKNTDGAGIVYADSTVKKQYTDYGTDVKIGTSVSSGEVAISINGDVTGKQFPNLRSAWFEYYAVTKDVDGIVDFIKLLSNGCELDGDTGNTNDFRDSYINEPSGIPANTVISGMSLNDVPIFTYDDLMLIKKLMLQNLFVKGNAYINELFVNNAHIPNTVRVLASAKMLRSDGSTAINTLYAYVTNFELIIAGTCTAADLGLDTTSTYSGATLTIPNSIMSLITSRSPLNAATGSASNDIILKANNSVDGVFYAKNTNGSINWNSRVSASTTVLNSGTFSLDTGGGNTSYCYSSPKIAVHFNLLFAGE